MKLLKAQMYSSVVALLIGVIASVQQFASSVIAIDVDDIEFTDTLSVLLGSGDYVDISYVLSETHLTIKLETDIDDVDGGWVGFGLAENATGSMKGADIVTAHFDKRGALIVEDRSLGWVPYPMKPSAAFPELDEQQDWVGLGGSEQDGRLSIVLQRLIDTGDSESDRVVETKYTSRIIAAKGRDRFVQYHNSNRGTGSIDFSKKLPPPGIAHQLPDDVDGSFELRMNNYSGFSGRETTYACRGYILDTTKTVDIVAFEPILQPENLHLLHHFVIYHCIVPHSHPFEDTLDSCQEIEKETGAQCFTYLYAWAVGGENLIFPRDVGLRIGAGDGQIHHVNFEVHYDNPNLEHTSDSSGVRLYYTETLRKHETYILTLGDPFVAMPQLAPQDPCLPRRGVCGPGCTDQFEGELTVFSSFLHMHARGRQAFTKLNGKIVARLDYWDFGFQNYLPRDYKIKPGDLLETQCNYDTSLDTEPVNFDLGSLDEMCMDFVYYYPRVPSASNCGYYQDSDAPINTLCGIQFLDTPQNPYTEDFLAPDFLKSQATCVNSVVETDPPKPSEPSEKEPNKLDTTTIAIIAVGAVVVVALVAAGIYAISRKPVEDKEKEVLVKLDAAKTTKDDVAVDAEKKEKVETSV